MPAAPCSEYKVNCISQIRDRQIIVFEYLNSNIQIPYRGHGYQMNFQTSLSFGPLLVKY